MRTTAILATVALLGLAGTLVLPHGTSGRAAAVEAREIWTEVPWPFPIDQWGKGKAFQCKAATCGTEVTIYIRAKIGFCNCSTGVADDEELDRISDFDLLGNQQGMGQFFMRVLFQLTRDAHVGRALEHLRIDDVGDDGLVLAREILVQEPSVSGNPKESNHLLAAVTDHFLAAVTHPRTPAAVNLGPLAP